MLKRFLLLGALLLASVSTATAQASRAVAVKAGRLIDGRSEAARSNVVILIRDGRIVAVGENLRFPADAEVVDLSRATVLPGLIDMHTHLTGNPRMFGMQGLGLSVPRKALYGAFAAREMLMAGFTTARNVGADGYGDVALRDAIDAGEIPGPRLLVSGPALGITGGHCDENRLPAEFNHRDDGVADGPWAVRAKVREVVKYGADVIKYCSTGGVLSKGDSPLHRQYTDAEMQALIDEAHTLGRKVAAHAHGVEGLKAAVRAGVDTIEHGTYMDDEAIELMNQRGAYLVPTLIALDSILEAGEARGIPEESLNKARVMAADRDRNLRRAFAAGVRVAFGTDAGVFPHAQAGREFGLLVKMGMTPMQAIRSATSVAAEALGLQADLGTIEVGRRADLIAVGGNPLENIRLLEDVKFVMKDGKVVKNSL